MTSRERVLAAINHQEPDRVPIDLGGMRSTGIMAIAYNRLKERLEMGGDTAHVYDVVQQLAQPEEAVLQFAQADVVDLGRAFWTEPEDWQDWPLPDGSGAKLPATAKLRCEPEGQYLDAEDGTVLGAMPTGALYLSQRYWPLADWDGSGDLANLPNLLKNVTWAALPTPPSHLPMTPEHVAEVRRRGQVLRDSTDYAIMAAFGGNLLEWGQFLCGSENFLCDLAANPAKVEKLLDRLVELHLANLEPFAKAVNGIVDLVQMGDDLGGQAGPQLSPAMYRRFFKERHRVLYDAVKEKTGAHLFLHSCGSVAALLPDLVDIGVEVLNPVQTNAAGMEPAFLKREFGQHLTFWGGGCDTRHVLPNGDAREIADHVKERVDTFAPGGGFVFTQVHNIMANVPPDNIVSMYEAIGRYGRQSG